MMDLGFHEIKSLRITNPQVFGASEPAHGSSGSDAFVTRSLLLTDAAGKTISIGLYAGSLEALTLKGETYETRNPDPPQGSLPPSGGRESEENPAMAFPAGSRGE